MSRSLRSCLTKHCRYCSVRSSPDTSELLGNFSCWNPSTEIQIPSLCAGLVARGGYYGGRQPLRRVRQECGPRPHSTTRFYLLCKSAPCWSHNSCACPVMNLLFTDTTYIVSSLRYKSSSGRSDIISRLFSISPSLFLFCCVVLATLTLTMATGRKLPAAVCFLHSVVINCVASW